MTCDYYIIHHAQCHIIHHKDKQNKVVSFPSCKRIFEENVCSENASSHEKMEKIAKNAAIYFPKTI